MSHIISNIKINLFFAFSYLFFTLFNNYSKSKYNLNKLIANFFLYFKQQPQNNDEQTYIKKEVNYEDKYLEKYNKLEHDFTEEDKRKEEHEYNKLQEELKNTIDTIEKRMAVLNKVLILEKNMEEWKKQNNEEEIKNEFSTLNEKLEKLKENNDDNKLKELAHNNILKEKRDRLKNNFIIEKTPIGNVLMFYNNARETFTYHSDNIIPYRFLEVVARKYVITFDCKSIYVDMNEVLREAEQKRKTIEDELLREKDMKNINTQNTQKKDVFAKFKNYNNSSKSSASNPKINNTEKKTNDDFIVKNKANRYTYEGKLSNFNILQKIDKKVTNKKLALSFADFKKLKTQ